MKKLIFYLVLSVFMSLSIPTKAQETNDYPDSLKGIVLKIEPLSLLYRHLSLGIEVPMGKFFLDVNVGVSGIGLSNYSYRSGGFLTKVGIKFPLKLNSPFSILYLMPEIAYSNYKLNNYYNPVTYNAEVKKVNANAMMVCFGYRHITPQSNFYYDGGIDLGYGWANAGWEARNNYNFQISNSGYSGNRISGVAISCHFAIGILIKPRSMP